MAQVLPVVCTRLLEVLGVRPFAQDFEASFALPLSPPL